MSSPYRKVVSVSNYTIPSSAVHYSSTLPVVSSPGLRTSSAQFDGGLREITRRYEEEARTVQKNYQVDFNNHTSLVKTVEELQIALEEERRRAIEFENKYNGAMIELDNERRIRVEVERENGLLREELRKAKALIAEYELRINKLQQDVTHLDAENRGLKAEIQRITDLYNANLRDLEARYSAQIRELTSENDRLRAQIESLRIEYENRLRELQREYSLKIASLEEAVRERDRRIVDLENEVRRITDLINRLKVEYEEEMRRQIALVREEEQRKYFAALQSLEAKLIQLQEDRDALLRKNQELLRELQVKERQIHDLSARYEAELARLRNEIADLRNQVNVLAVTNEKLNKDVIARDQLISRLEADIANLQREIKRLEELHISEMNRLINEQNNERRRWEESERHLNATIIELEKVVRALQAENAKLISDLERLKQSISGNINKTIFQTFVEHESTSPTKSFKIMY